MTPKQGGPLGGLDSVANQGSLNKNTKQATQSDSAGLFWHDQFWPVKAADLPNWRTTR
jgi:hypothetical protein